MSRRLGAAACLVLVSIVPGCGGGGSAGRTINADDLRDCLGTHGASFTAESGGASFVPFAVDFRATIGHTSIAVSTSANAATARRAAADARSALGSVGVPQGSGNVIQHENAVVIFDPAPSPPARAAVNACLTER